MQITRSARCIRISYPEIIFEGVPARRAQGYLSPEELINVISDPPVILHSLAESPKFSSDFGGLRSQRRRVIRNRRRHATRHVRVFYCQICLKIPDARAACSDKFVPPMPLAPHNRVKSRSRARQIHHHRPWHIRFARANGPMQLALSDKELAQQRPSRPAPLNRFYKLQSEGQFSQVPPQYFVSARAPLRLLPSFPYLSDHTYIDKDFLPSCVSPLPAAPSWGTRASGPQEIRPSIFPVQISGRARSTRNTRPRLPSRRPSLTARIRHFHHAVRG